jgi:hypothetical protein
MTRWHGELANHRHALLTRVKRAISHTVAGSRFLFNVLKASGMTPTFDCAAPLSPGFHSIQDDGVDHADASELLLPPLRDHDGGLTSAMATKFALPFSFTKNCSAGPIT